MSISNRFALFASASLGSSTFHSRRISTTSAALGKKNFRQLFLGNKRGTRFYKEQRAKDRHYIEDIPIYTDVKPIGYYYGEAYKIVPEMIPELIVPDLTDCQLKPYVSYRTSDIVQEEFTAKSLFSFVYEEKIKENFKNDGLDSAGQPLEPSDEEKMSAEEAYLKARRTGSDLFSERIPKHWECLGLTGEFNTT